MWESNGWTTAKELMQDPMWILRRMLWNMLGQWELRQGDFPDESNIEHWNDSLWMAQRLHGQGNN